MEALFSAKRETAFPVHTLGENAEVGTTDDAAVDSTRQRIAVLNAHGAAIVIRDFAGRVIQRIGRAATGEAPFRDALSVAFSPDGRLYVGTLDHKVIEFIPTPDGFLRRRVIDIPVAARDMCIARDEIIVHGVNSSGTIVYRYSMDGHLLRSFGTVYSSRNALVMSDISKGLIGCFPSERIILFAPKSVLNQVRAYSWDGEILWIDTLDGYKPMAVTEADGAMRVRIPESGFNRVHQLIVIDETHALLQVALVKGRTQASQHGYETLRSVLVDVRSGQAVETSDSVSEVYAVSSGTVLYTEKNDPSAVLKLLRQPNVPKAGH